LDRDFRPGWLDYFLLEPFSFDDLVRLSKPF